MQSPDSSPDSPSPQSNGIITELASAEVKLKLQVIQKLIEPCDRTTYGKRLQSAAETLNCSVRTIQRLVKKWEEEGLAAFVQDGRSDKGRHRISKEWEKFIVEAWNDGKCTPAQVAIKVKSRAKTQGQNAYPSHMTVYRVLTPHIQQKQQSANIRNVGWRGSRLALKTRAGEEIPIEYSNQVWQCDHTRADILLVDQHGELLTRPWLTIVIDTYSRCIMGLNLGFDAPSSQVDALALRHAILPKQYGANYKLHVDWTTFGKPEYLFTDGGKDFRSNHLQQIGVQLGFTCHLRARKEEGGIVERPFGTFNTEFFSTLPGYTGSNVQERPEEAEKEASLTLQDLERLFVAYLVNRYNRALDARMKDQTRIERWEAGLLKQPSILDERELDICLMKQTRRIIYRGGYLTFENLTYQSNELIAYAGETIVLRFDPRDITRVLVYSREAEHDAQGALVSAKETLLATAIAEGFKNEQFSLEEAKANSRLIRKRGETVNEQSMLNEIHDREAFINEKKKSRRDRQKEEQALVRPKQQPTNLWTAEHESFVEEPSDVTKFEIPQYKVWDFDDDN